MAMSKEEAQKILKISESATLRELTVALVKAKKSNPNQELVIEAYNSYKASLTVGAVWGQEDTNQVDYSHLIPSIKPASIYANVVRGKILAPKVESEEPFTVGTFINEPTDEIIFTPVDVTTGSLVFAVGLESLLQGTVQLARGGSL